MPRKVDRGSKEPKIKSVVDAAPGVGRFTLERIQPHLRSELNRRIMAIAEDSADRIGSECEAVIEATLKRFADWITPESDNHTSITTTAGWWSWIKAHLTGRNHPESQKRNRELPSALADMSFEDRWRMVMIDQGIWFTACLNEMIAMNDNAIAMIWHSHWRQENYDYNTKSHCA